MISKFSLFFWLDEQIDHIMNETNLKFILNETIKSDLLSYKNLNNNLQQNNSKKNLPPNNEQHLNRINLSIQQTMSVPKSRPKKIEQYQVLDLLGKGGNGVVYKGIDMGKGTFVAIKEIVIEKTEIKNIKFEINVLKELNDPFIVKYIDAIQVNNRIYLVLEYLEGGSLGSLVQKTPLQQKLVKKYIKQVLKGLQYLHKHHVAHRDLKGTNILLTKEGKAKITDFGVAIQVNDTQKTLSSAGTPYWMAPEAIINQAATNVECDIWSLGCTVIQLLTGNPPYHDLMPYPALFRIVQDMHPPLPQNITPLCNQFLMRCFVKDPKKRAKASQLLKHKWIKQANQHKSSSFSVDIENIVFENDTKISTLIRQAAWQELYQLTLNTTNKKTIYYNKSFVLVNQSPNTDQKLKFIKQLIIHNHQALKYLSTIGVIKKLLQAQLRQGWRITKLKLIEFLCECYQLCEQSNDLLVWLSDFLAVFKHLVLYMAQNQKELPKRIVHLAKILDLLYKLINSSLLIDEHLMFMLQENNQDQVEQQATLNIYFNLLTVIEFILSLKNSEMSFQLVSIVKKHILYGKQTEHSLEIYLENNRLRPFLALSECFYDFRVLFQFISLLKIVVGVGQFRRYLEKDVMILGEITKTLGKLMNLPTITMEQHQILLEIIQFLMVYFSGPSQTANKQLMTQFVQLGGVKTLTSMPESYRKNEKIYENVSGLIEFLDV